MSITLQQFVDREVITCVSMLISELVHKDKYRDELFPICVQDDWENAAKDSGWSDPTEDEYGANIYTHEDGTTYAAKNFHDLCEAFEIEPQQIEAYEHWVVSEWLADKLISKGEMVLKDFYGLTIWGRTNCGQAIMLDGVIQEIYSELTGKVIDHDLLRRM